MFQRIHGPFGPDPRKIHQGLRRFITARKESTASVAHLGIGPLGSSVKLPGARLGNWWFRNPHTKDFGKTWINSKNSFFVWWDCQGLVNLKMCKCLWTRQWVRCDFHDERKTSLRRWSRCNLADYETHSADSRSFSVFSTMQQYSSQWVLWPFSYYWTGKVCLVHEIIIFTCRTVF